MVVGAGQFRESFQAAELGASSSTRSRGPGSLSRPSMTVSEAGTSVMGEEEREASLKAMEQVGRCRYNFCRTAAAAAAAMLQQQRSLWPVLWFLLLPRSAAAVLLLPCGWLGLPSPAANPKFRHLLCNVRMNALGWLQMLVKKQVHLESQQHKLAQWAMELQRREMELQVGHRVFFLKTWSAGCFP